LGDVTNVGRDGQKFIRAREHEVGFFQLRTFRVSMPAVIARGFPERVPAWYLGDL